MPGSSTQPPVRVDQYDRSRSVSVNETVSDAPGSSATLAKPLSSRTGRATDASWSPT